MENLSISFLQGAVIFLAGCIAGAMNSIAGGGTLVSFPVLVFAGLPSITANITSTIALLLGTFSSVVAYKKNFFPAAHWLKIFVPVSLLGGLIGSILLVQTPPEIFDAIAPFLILFATLLFMTQNLFSKLSFKSLTFAAILQFAVAIYGGYFGAGIGILMLASLGMLGFKDIHQMNSLKVILSFIINLIAAIYFIFTGLVSWEEAGILATGAIIGGYYGAYFAQQIKQSQVRAIIVSIGLIISGMMFYKQFGF